VAGGISSGALTGTVRRGVLQRPVGSKSGFSMLDVYLPSGSSLERRTLVSGDEVPDHAVWFDLINPAPGEDKLIEAKLGIAVPTREEMQEIEVSSRLYTEHHARFMTATLMCNSDTVVPKTTAVTFILAKHCLVTVRYDEPKPFMLTSNKLTRSCPHGITGETVLMELLDAVIDREADLLERIGIDVDQVSHDIFDPHGRGPEQGNAYIDTLKVIGIKGDLTSKVRESLVSLGRLLLFIANEAEGMRWSKDVRLQLQSMQRDVLSLSDHATYLANKITFLLDALLGVVTLEQNNVIKIFSIAAVVFLPPTLVGTVYGMNFKNMPELEWFYGYPMALTMMVIAAILPYYFFKWKKWL
jgi:magnesium transporter